MSSDLPQTSRLLERGRDEGLHLGGQLYVSLAGREVVDLAFGEAEGGTPMRPDHLMLWLSATKPITAVAVARLWEAGELDLDDSVGRFIPEFASRGKEGVTLRHLLTHTGGIRALDVGWPGRGWAEIIDRICQMKLEPRWVPGEKAGYHLASSWFVLAEVVQRLSGRGISEVLRQEIFEPLGMDECWVGMPVERYRELAPRIAPVWNTEGGESERHDWTSERRIVAPSPGANGVGPMRQLARFYQMLLGRGRLGGVELLTPQTVEALTARQRVGLFDHTFRQTLDWGLGFVLDSTHYGDARPAYGYGERASRRVFGHSGYRSTTAFGDPAFGLVVALAVNGTPSAEAHATRFHRLTTAIYEDLGLATPAASSTAGRRPG